MPGNSPSASVAVGCRVIFRACQERSFSKTWLRRSADSGGVISNKAGLVIWCTWCAGLPTGQAYFTHHLPNLPVILMPPNSAPGTTKSKPTVQNKVPCLVEQLPIFHLIFGSHWKHYQAKWAVSHDALAGLMIPGLVCRVDAFPANNANLGPLCGICSAE
jgi:hypothetical protein